MGMLIDVENLDPFLSLPSSFPSKVEYMVISLDDENRRALLSLRQSEILEELQSVVLDLCNEKPEQRWPALLFRARFKCCFADSNSKSYSMVVPTFHPEYGRFMLESTPGAPYSGNLKDLIGVEANMRFR